MTVSDNNELKKWILRVAISSVRAILEVLVNESKHVSGKPLSGKN